MDAGSYDSRTTWHLTTPRHWACLRPQSKWSFGKVAGPGYVVTWENLPEAVEDWYFGVQRGARGEQKIVGSFARESTQNMVEQTLARIHRFRQDVEWNVFHAPPSPEDLAGVDCWVDPAVQDSDLDGFTAEALVVGLPVVAARTALNTIRLEQGRSGWLVPARDPNEMTHVILSALFKTEVAENKQFAARQTVSKFRARQRLRILNRLYDVVKNT